MSCPLTLSKEDLFSQYGCIFEGVNRNSSSHRWVNHILSHSESMTEEELREQAFSFCPVSGSPVSREDSTFPLSVPTSSSEMVEGRVTHCCWPCSCDMQEAAEKGRLRAERVDVRTKEGSASLTLLLIPDPCSDPSSTIPLSAPGITCGEDGVIEGAFLLKGKEGRNEVGIGFLEEGTLPHSDFPVYLCQKREEEGYRSGMGTIFRQVVGI